MKRRRLCAGGSSAAASTSTGMPAACATRATAVSEGRALGTGEIQYPRGRLTDGALDLPGFGVAHAAVREAIGQSHFDQPCAGGAHPVVVGIAVTACDDEFVTHPAGVRQTRHLDGVEPGHAGGRTDQQSGHGTGRDDAGRGARHLCEDVGSAGLELCNVDTCIAPPRPWRRPLPRTRDSRPGASRCRWH